MPEHGIMLSGFSGFRAFVVCKKAGIKYWEIAL